MWDFESVGIFRVPFFVLAVFVQASLIVLPIPDRPFVMPPESKLGDCVLPHFRPKYVHITLDLVLHRLAEPYVRALEQKYEGVNGANSPDLLCEGDSVLAIPPFGVAGPRGVDDCYAGVGRVSKVVANEPGCLVSEGFCTMADSKPMLYVDIFSCSFISVPSTKLEANSFSSLVLWRYVEEPESIGK